MKPKNLFLYMFIFFFLFHLFSAVWSIAEENPLYIVFLLDSSGSMKGTDPDGIRKLAAEAVVTLLSPDDQVAIVEFDSTGRVLLDWHAASDKKALFEAIDRTGNKGEFTDFRSGLETADKLTKNVPKEARKFILLLSDGILEPDPNSDIYAPYYIKYKFATTGKNAAQRVRIYNEEYRDKLSSIARRIINTEILPSIKENNGEIFTVALSPKADDLFLAQLSNETSSADTEIHYFHANEAVDLMDTFLGLLHYWADMMKIYVEEGNAYQGYKKDIFLDEFLKDIFFLALTEKECNITLQSEDRIEEAPIEGIHPKVKIIPIIKKFPPGNWSYNFNNSAGNYRIMILGKSAIAMEVNGIKEQYLFGEPIKAFITIRNEDKDARKFLSPGANVIADIISDEKKEQINSQETQEGFDFQYLPFKSGAYKIRFNLFAKDLSGREIRPRPSKEYKIQVMPNFFVKPDYIDFGELKRGGAKSSLVNVQSGLSSKTNIHVRGEINSYGKYMGKPEKLPFIEDFSFPVISGQRLQKEVSVSIPKKGGWGDFDGKIIFEAESGESYSIEFHVHVPSWVEKATKIVPILLSIIFLVLLVLGISWSRLKKPVGVLRADEVPSGVIMDEMDLSKVKKGIWNRWLNWKKNKITLGGDKCDINLAGISEDMRVKLTFYRFGSSYIQNISSKNTDVGDPGRIITVINPDVGLEIPRGPDETYELIHELIIKMGDYTFRYLDY